MTYRTFALTGATLCGLVVLWSVSPNFRELTGITPDALEPHRRTPVTGPLARSGPQPLQATPLPTAAPAPAPPPVASGPSRLAPARPALGFRLDESTRREVKDWTGQHGLDCHDSEQRKLDFWVCDSVVADAVGLGAQPQIRFLTFGFAPDDTLISVTLIRPGLQTQELLTVLRTERLRLAPRLGSPTSVQGELSAEAFDHGGRLKVEYRYGDYLAVLRAIGNAGGAGELAEFFESNRALRLYYR